jgi:hypothetical protein
MEQGHEPRSFRSRVSKYRDKKSPHGDAMRALFLYEVDLYGSGCRVVIDRAMDECADDGTGDWCGPEQPEL